MKAKLKTVTAIACAIMSAVSLTACGSGKSTLLGKPKTVERVEYSALNTEDYKTLKNGVEAFAADFAAYTYSDHDKQSNFAVSPISVYMALALAVECAAVDTRQEILDALGVTHQQLKEQFPTLYRSLAVEHKSDGGTTSLLDPINSIWVNNGTSVKQSCIDSLSNDYYTYSYSADFRHDNDRANKAVRDFVKKHTNGLIDQDFGLTKDTLFALINALYFKTVWQELGDDLPFAEGNYDFTAKDGTVKTVQLFRGDYFSGRAVETDTYTTFYMRSYDDYEIKFILPKDNYTIDQVFTAENIAAVNSLTDYGYYNDAHTERYITRVLFPEYNCKYDNDVADVLQNKFDIDLLFKADSGHSSGCDFSALTDSPCHCAKIRHVTDLTVNRKGIEGAAVTAVLAAGAAPPDEIVTVEADFVVDRAFGFIITDWQDITLFSGVVNNI